MKAVPLNAPGMIALGPRYQVHSRDARPTLIVSSVLSAVTLAIALTITGRIH
jgi:hypothetical protein